jgi:hypothetical protein
MMDVQLVDAMEEFEPNHDMESHLFNALGRRHQDKRNLADQIEAENKKAAGNSREHLTVDMVQF